MPLEQKSNRVSTTAQAIQVTLSNVTAGRLVVVTVWAFARSSAAYGFNATASDNQGGSLARAVQSTAASGTGRWAAAIFYGILPGSYATYTVTVTALAADSYQLEAVASEFSGDSLTLDQIAANYSNTPVSSPRGTGNTPTNGPDTRLAVSVFTVSGDASNTGIAQNGGVNWPTTFAAPDTDGCTLGVQQDNTIGMAGMAACSISDNWRSAVASDSWSWTAPDDEFAACIATFKEAASEPAETTGTGAASLPLPTASGSGAEMFAATGSASLPTLTGATTGTLTFDGAVASSLPALTSEASGLETISGQGAASLPLPTASAEGAVEQAGSYGAATLPLLTGAATGALTFEGAVAASLPLLTSEASGATLTPATGAGAGTLPLLTGSASGSLAIAGTGAGTLPLLTAYGSERALVPLPRHRIATAVGRLVIATALGRQRVRTEAGRRTARTEG